MTMPDGSAAASEAPASTTTAASEGSVTETAQQRRERAMNLATTMQVPGAPGVPSLDGEASAVAVAAANAAAEDPMAAATVAVEAPATETAEEREQRLGALTPEARAEAERVEAEAATTAAAAGDSGAGEASEPADVPAFTVEIPIAGTDVPFVVDVADEETANQLTDLVRRAVRGDQARAIREDAQRLRDQADEFHYVLELDPAGVVTEAIKNPQDIEHLFRYLATRPGVLARNQEWIDGMLANPDSLQTQSELAELERMKRKESVKAQVDDKREVRQYQRALAGSIHKSIESLAPDAFSPKGRDLLYDDVIKDVRAFMDSNNLRTMDLRRVPGIIQHRFGLMGITPKSTNHGTEEPRETAKPAVVPVVPVVAPKVGVLPTQKTAAELKAASAARQAVSTAPAGPGGAMTTLPTPPAFDPKAPGNPIQQRVAWAKKFLLPSLTKKPQ